MSEKLINCSLLQHFFDGLKELFVPVTRKINGKALSEDITLTAADLGVTGVSSSLPFVMKTLSFNTSSSWSYPDSITLSSGVWLICLYLSAASYSSAGRTITQLVEEPGTTLESILTGQTIYTSSGVTQYFSMAAPIFLSAEETVGVKIISNAKRATTGTLIAIKLADSFTR